MCRTENDCNNVHPKRDNFTESMQESNFFFNQMNTKLIRGRNKAFINLGLISKLGFDLILKW